MEQDSASELHNKAIVQASFARWENGTGGPFELLAPDAEWTIVGSSPLSKTYRSKQEFLDKVISPFNARMAKPLVPTIRGLYADGDMVIIWFDAAATAKDGVPYYNTYTWYFQMKAGQVPFLTHESSMNSGAACRLHLDLAFLSPSSCPLLRNTSRVTSFSRRASASNFFSRVFRSEVLQALRIGDTHAAELAPPEVVAPVGEAVLPTALDKGQAAIDIDINVADEIVAAAQGSFYIAQLLAHEVCVRAGVMERPDSHKRVEVSFEGVRAGSCPVLYNSFAESQERMARTSAGERSR